MIKAIIIAIGLFISCECYGGAILYETITIGTSSVVAGTATLSSAGYDKYLADKIAGNTYADFASTYYGSDTTTMYRMDGGTPTASAGMPLIAGERITVDNIEDARRIKFFNTSSSATGTVYGEHKEKKK